jgi:hypothetical protein
MQPATDAFQDLSILLDWDDDDENGDDDTDELLKNDVEQSPTLPTPSLQPEEEQQHRHDDEQQQQRHDAHYSMMMNSSVTPEFRRDDEGDDRLGHGGAAPARGANSKDKATSSLLSKASSSVQGGGGGGRTCYLSSLLGAQQGQHNDVNSSNNNTALGRDDAWNERVDKLLHFVENYEFSKTPAMKTPRTSKPPRTSSSPAVVATTASAAATDTSSNTTATIRRHTTLDDSSCCKQFSEDKKAEQFFQRRQCSPRSKKKKNGEIFGKDGNDKLHQKSNESCVTVNTSPAESASVAATTIGEEQAASSPSSFHHQGAITGMSSSEVTTRGQHNDECTTDKINVVTTAEELCQEAQQERQAARTWAHEVRAAASKWIREQDELQKMLQLQLEQQQQELRADQMKQAASAMGDNSHSHQDTTATMLTLELHHHQKVVQQLEDELDQARQRHLAIQEQLHCIIDDQQERIQYLEQQLLQLEIKHKDARFSVEQQAPSSPSPDGQSQHRQVEDNGNQRRNLFKTTRINEQQQKHQQPQQQSVAAADDSSPRSVFTTTPFTLRPSQTDNDSPQSNLNVNNHSILISPESVEVPAASAIASAFDRGIRDSDTLADGSHSNKIGQLGHCSTIQKTLHHDENEPQTEMQQPCRKHRRRCRFKTPEGHDVIQYANGTEKEIRADGTTVLRFANGDIQTNSGGDGIGSSTAYYFAGTNVLRLVQTDKGFILYEYPNGQIEQHWYDETGRKVVHLPDGTRYEVVASSSNQQ